MTSPVWGGLLGLLGAVGGWIVVARVAELRRPALQIRVVPYLRDLDPDRARSASVVPGGRVGALATPALRRAADLVDQVLGGSVSIRRRLLRAGLNMTVQDFRVQQVLWGLSGLLAAVAWGLLRSITGSPDPVTPVLACVGAFVAGVLLRENRLTSQVKSREAAIVAELPAVAELLALSVAAGEGPVAALDRVVRRSGGEFSRDLAGVLARIRTGEPVTDAFDRLAATTGLPVVARFAHGVAVAVERGTPLADVLHAQAADVREAGRRDLIERAARKEVVMMIPVVFLILPVTVLFAFWPGFIGLSLSY
ncbi:type II secretion system F family protein [Nocardioides sp.]|uniref:type II secretion system F family protein n=1 Tax=Nocardioides sp. TaxID=35761 RepID=UPI003513C155